MKRIISKNGFTLLELVVVITLLAIIGVPIVESIISSMKSSEDSKQKLDATLIADKLCEAIEVGGISATNTPELDATELVQKQYPYNNNTYYLSWDSIADNLGDPDNEAGSYSLEGYKDYYLIELNNDTLEITKKYQDGNEVTYSQKSTPLKHNECSLVFSDNKLDLYSYDKLDPSKNTSEYGSISETEIFKFTKYRNVRIINKRSSLVKLKLYNNFIGEPKMLNVFYYSVLNAVNPASPSIGDIEFDINYDNNIVIRDLKNVIGTNELDFNKDIVEQTYVITVRKIDTAEPLITREVTYISKKVN